MGGTTVRGGSLPAEVRVEIVTGHAAVMARLGEVDTFLAGSAQRDEFADLPYFLAKPRRIKHDPCLLLLYDSGVAVLVGAVVLFEFRTWMRGQRIFSCYSRRGRRTVLGPLEHRVEIAAIAAQALLARGAHFVNIEINQGRSEANPLLRDLAAQHARRVAEPRLQAVNRRSQFAVHAGLKYFELPLTDRFDSTLAGMHQKTRKNLRYHQRRAIRELNCRFVAALTLDRQSFMRLHTECDYPVRPAVAAWRFDSLAQFPHTFLSGLQDGNGHWLALAGGRRSHGTVELDWQINRRHAVISVTTAMRAFLIEEAIRSGATSFSMEGGTLTPSVLHSFQQHSVINLAVRRNTLRLRLLEHLLLWFYPGRYVTRVLSKPWRIWRAIF